MGLHSNKIDKTMLKPGDHIYCYRKLHSYSHHGIYVENDRVIHFTRTEGNNVGEPSNNRCRCSAVCGYQQEVHRGVVKSCVDCFLRGHTLNAFEYNVSEAHFFVKRPGTCSVESSDPSDVVVERATRMLADSKGFGEYDLFNNNCESFAVYCTTGVAASGQALAAKSKAKIAMKNLTQKPISLENIASTVVQAAVSYKITAIQQNKNQINASSSSERDLQK